MHELRAVVVTAKSEPETVETTLVPAPEQYAAMGLLGCGVMSGIGAVLNTAAVRRGESVAVLGCGGVGTAAVAGAQLAGARTSIAVDLEDAKLEQARSFGATHTVNSTDTDPVEAFRGFTGGHGGHVVVDAGGIGATFAQALAARDLAGRMVLVGVPAPATTRELPLGEVFGRGGSTSSSWYGNRLPSRGFPMLVDQYRAGRLGLDGGPGRWRTRCGSSATTTSAPRSACTPPTPCSGNRSTPTPASTPRSPTGRSSPWPG